MCLISYPFLLWPGAVPFPPIYFSILHKADFGVEDPFGFSGIWCLWIL